MREVFACLMLLAATAVPASPAGAADLPPGRAAELERLVLQD